METFVLCIFFTDFLHMGGVSVIICDDLTTYNSILKGFLDSLVIISNA